MSEQNKLPAPKLPSVWTAEDDRKLHADLNSMTNSAISVLQGLAYTEALLEHLITTCGPVAAFPNFVNGVDAAVHIAMRASADPDNPQASDLLKGLQILLCATYKMSLIATEGANRLHNPNHPYGPDDPIIL